MALTKLLNLLAISCLAIIASYGSTPVAALSLDGPRHNARHNAHADLAKKRRATSSKRCKPRTTSITSTKAATSSAYQPAETTKAPSSNSGSSNPPAPPPPPAPKPPASSGGSNNGAKAGIAWPLGNDKSIQSFKTPKVDTYYTWSPWCVDYANAVGMQCCPMLWGWKQVSQFTSLVKEGYANCVMGPNEPDQSGQANMSPGDAVGLWRQYIDPLKAKGYKTISPATTSSPAGFQWTHDFLAACTGCHIDVVAFHYYGTSADDFIAYVEKVHNAFGKNIWVTEFACQNFGNGNQCSWDQVFSFMSTVTSWMDSTPYVEKYFAFGAMHDMYNVNPDNQLLGSNGKPTALGNLYIGA